MSDCTASDSLGYKVNCPERKNMQMTMQEVMWRKNRDMMNWKMRFAYSVLVFIPEDMFSIASHVLEITDLRDPPFLKISNDLRNLTKISSF